MNPARIFAFLRRPARLARGAFDAMAKIRLAA
jgi:hypothetical protein